METTFVMIKPDGVQRGLVGNIISRFEKKGLRLVGLRSFTPSKELASKHYEVHKDGKKINPAYYFHNDLTPEEFDRMLELAAQENQSFD